jgi:hypothetical protein
MSKVIRVPESLYKQLEDLAVGFDTPAGVIERLINFYEENSGGVDQIDKQKPSPDKPSYFKSKTSENFSHDFGPEKYILTASDGDIIRIDLPDRNDKEGIRRATEEAMEFVDSKGGTVGQRNAARKMFTDNGYHITR